MMMAGAPMFWGAEIKAGNGTAIDPDIDEVFHLTHFALGEGAKDGERVTISLESEDGKFVIGTLVKDRCDQFSADLLIAGGDLATLKHSSKKASVSVTGYRQEDIDTDFDDFDEDYLEEEDDHDEQTKASLEKVLKNKLGNMAGGDNEDEDDESDDEFKGDMQVDGDDSDDSDDIDFDEEDDDSDDDDSDDDDSDDDDSDSGDSDDSDDSGASDSDDSDDEDSDDDDKLQKLKGSKRPSSSPVTPPSSAGKKAKTSDSTPSSATSTPGKTPVPGDAKSYEADLVGFLSKHGKTALAIVGTRVRKPSGVPKLKLFVADRPNVFKLKDNELELA